MSSRGLNDQPADAEDINLLIENHEIRIAKLEGNNQKHIFRRLTENAGAIALFLGLVLTAVSLYDALVVKPEADRINRISQFNAAVNSAAKTQQELQAQAANPSVYVAVAGPMVPEILNDIATARAILRDLKDDDVGISQLVILIEVALATHDTSSAKDFVVRAVAKTNEPPILRSEAKRFEGKYFFLIGDAGRGRQSFKDATKILGDSPEFIAARAYDFADWIVTELATGDCSDATTAIEYFRADLQRVPPSVRLGIVQPLRAQLTQLQGAQCAAADRLSEDLMK
jgi:hypothetical protein